MCLTEKLHIANNYNDRQYLNRRGEMAQKCRHKSRFLLQPPKKGGPAGRTSRYCTGGEGTDSRIDATGCLATSVAETRSFPPSGSRAESNSHCTRSCDKWSTTKLRSRSSPTTWDAIRYPDQHRQQPSCTLTVKFFELTLFQNCVKMCQSASQ